MLSVQFCNWMPRIVVDNRLDLYYIRPQVKAELVVWLLVAMIRVTAIGSVSVVKD